MIKKILTGVAIAMLVVGIGLVAFPTISNFIGTQISNGEADGFDTRVEEAEDGSFEQAVKDGKVDEEGYKIDREGKRTSKQPVVFKADAETINMRLPIYLGANSSNMSYGAAHMSATSLPIGGKNTNAVLAGHTGYIGRIFFDNLRNLKIGDRVSITNYWDTLNYKVVETKVNKPSESGDCYLQKDRDLLTMFTCISDGNGGFDRYYVICERVS